MDADSTVELRTGSRMPVLGLGTWQLTDGTAGTVEAALGMGYRLIDTSGDYGTQPGIGEALRRTDVDRERIYLVTKVEEDEDAYEATRRNLEELDQDYADLMLIHRPPPSGAGEALWEGLIRARAEGLTRDIGVSNYTAEQIEALERASGETPAVNQVEWSPFGWSRELLEWSAGRGIVIQAYSPLTRARRLGDARLVAIAERHDATPAQVLIRWNLEHGAVPLPKANRRDHLVEDLGALDVGLTRADVEELDRLNEHSSSLGTLPYA